MCPACAAEHKLNKVPRKGCVRGGMIDWGGYGTVRENGRCSAVTAPLASAAHLRVLYLISSNYHAPFQGLNGDSSPFSAEFFATNPLGF